jgi:hypothetical protein
MGNRQPIIERNEGVKERWVMLKVMRESYAPSVEFPVM